MNRIAIMIGTILCAIVKGRSSRLYRTFRYSLRSGNWDVRRAYRLALSIKEEQTKSSY